MRSLETSYNGYLFRSRLEARWAIFLDTLGIAYRYEPKLYRFSYSKMQYLPDFYLPVYRKFIEIKPYTPDEEEIEKAKLLVQRTAHPILMVCGQPWPGEYQIIPITPVSGRGLPVIFANSSPHYFGYGSMTKTLYMTYYFREKFQFYPLNALWVANTERIVPKITKMDALTHLSELKDKRVEALFASPSLPLQRKSLLMDAYLAARRTHFRFQPQSVDQNLVMEVGSRNKGDYSMK